VNKYAAICGIWIGAGISALGDGGAYIGIVVFMAMLATWIISEN